jgi:hypothetical protein
MATPSTVRYKHWVTGTSTYESCCYSKNFLVGTLHSAHFTELKKRADITNKDISAALKRAATVLDYPMAKGIPINQINTHSLRSSRANALSLAGFSDTKIHNMGRWRGATFKEYIQEKLASFLEGMSRKMKQKFHFVNVASNSFKNITDDLISFEYMVNATSA